MVEKREALKADIRELREFMQNVIDISSGSDNHEEEIGGVKSF